MMKNLLFIVACSLSLVSIAQQGSQKTFLISSPKGSLNYVNITAVDIHAGKLITDIYNPSKNYVYRSSGFRSYLSLQKNIFLDNTGATYIDTLRTPMGGAVACTAYDQKTNRLFFVPQHLSELRYIDLNQPDPSFTYLDNQSLNLLHNPDDVANQITRMTIASDGFGYALTNDGEHLIKFTTEGTPVIQDLGVLIDKPTNQVFVRSSCSSWGGDMVADANGNLYLISQFNHLFKISLPSKVCEYMGYISFLPPSFNTNGATVDENGDLILSCGSSLDKGIPPFYKVTNWSYLQAAPLEENNMGWGNISDMASSNFLFQKSTAAAPATTTATIIKTAEAPKVPLPTYTIYPNPVSHGKFTIKTTNIAEKGEYKMMVLDLTGRSVMEGKMNLGLKSNTNSFIFPSQEAKGTYMVLIVDYFNRTVYSQLLLVQ
jgi:hypothetical protein